MKIGKTLHVSTRRAWRAWLRKHHAKEKDIWLVYHSKESGKARIPYNDAVEEAICFGWIDSTVKKVESEWVAQRFSPRKPGSTWSEMNKERGRRLIRARKMTPAGLAALGDLLKVTRGNVIETTIKIPRDILECLREDKTVWQNFQRFPKSYKRIRIGWIDAARKRPAEFERRLRYFLKMTAQNKRFGMVQ